MYNNTTQESCKAYAFTRVHTYARKHVRMYVRTYSFMNIRMCVRTYVHMYYVNTHVRIVRVLYTYAREYFHVSNQTPPHHSTVYLDKAKVKDVRRGSLHSCETAKQTSQPDQPSYAQRHILVQYYHDQHSFVVSHCYVRMHHMHVVQTKAVHIPTIKITHSSLEVRNEGRLFINPTAHRVRAMHGASRSKSSTHVHGCTRKKQMKNKQKWTTGAGVRGIGDKGYKEGE